MKEYGIHYEQYCCKYLEQEGYSTEMTIASGDQGVDIIATKNDVRYAIQCKYRSDGMIGNDAIQQVASGKDFYDCDIAVVMTNRTFTPKAIELAQKLRVKMWGCIDFPEHYQNDNDIKNEYDDTNHSSSNAIISNAAKSNIMKDAATVLSEIDEACSILASFKSDEFQIRKGPVFDDPDDKKDTYSIYGKHLFNDYNMRMTSIGMRKAKELELQLEEITEHHFDVFDYSFCEGKDVCIICNE